MSTQSTPLVITPNDLGPAADTSGMAADKTVVIKGLSQGKMIVEGSNDGGSTWCPVAELAGGGAESFSFEAVAELLRVDARQGIASSAECTAESSLCKFVSLTAPANGPGASQDITDLGSMITAVAGVGAGSVALEISQDNASWGPAISFKSFSKDSCDTGDLPAKYARAVGTNYGGSGIHLGAVDDVFSAIGDAVTAGSDGINLVTWRPGADKQFDVAFAGLTNEIQNGFTANPGLAIGNRITFSGGAVAAVISTDGAYGGGAPPTPAGVARLSLLSGPLPLSGETFVGRPARDNFGPSFGTSVAGNITADAVYNAAENLKWANPNNGGMFTGLGSAGMSEALAFARENEARFTIDQRFVPGWGNYSEPAIVIPTSVGEPGGFWDLTGIIYYGISKVFFGAFADDAQHFFEDGARFAALGSNMNFEAKDNMYFAPLESMTTVPFQAVDQGIRCKGGRVLWYDGFLYYKTFSPWAGPMIKADGEFLSMVANDDCRMTLGATFGNYPQGTMLDTNGLYIQFGGNSASKRDGAVADSSGGPGAFFAWQINSNDSIAQGNRGAGIYGSGITMADEDLTISSKATSVQMSAYLQSGPIGPSSGGGNLIGPAKRTRIASDAGDVAITAPNAGPGFYWGVDNFGASNKGVVSPQFADQTIDGKFSDAVHAKTRKTYRGDAGRNDNILVTYDALVGSFLGGTGGVDLTWAGGSGEILDDNGTDMVVRLATGAAPVDDEALAQGGVTADTNGAPVEFVPNWDLVDYKSLLDNGTTFVYRPDSDRYFQLPYDNKGGAAAAAPAGPVGFAVGEVISWAGGSARVLDRGDSGVFPAMTGTVIASIMAGSLPADDAVVTGGTTGVTVDTDGVVSLDKSFLPDANGYLTWESAFAAARSLANSSGEATILVDSRFSTHVDGFGDVSCPVPAGAYDMRNIIISTPQPAGDSINENRLDMLDGAVWDGFAGIFPASCNWLRLTYDGISGPCWTNFTDLIMFGNGVTLTNSIVGASPFIVAGAAGLGVQLHASGSTTQLGGRSGTEALAPVIDINSQFLFLETKDGGPRNNSFTDTGDDGFVAVESGSNGYNGNDWTLSNAGWMSGTYIHEWYMDTKPRFHDIFDTYSWAGNMYYGGWTFADSPATMPWGGGTIPVDSTGGPVVINLYPDTPWRHGEDTTVTDVGGAATANPITVNLAPGMAFPGGATSVVLSVNYGSVHIRTSSDGLTAYLLDQDRQVVALGGAVGPLTLAPFVGGAGGPTAAAQATWVQIDIGGTLYWMPAWT